MPIKAGHKVRSTRAEVRGGGAKLDKRDGQQDKALFAHRNGERGGVVFALPRDFSKINRKMKTAALKSALSQKVRQDEFIVIKTLLFRSKTKFMAAILKNFELKGKTLSYLARQQSDNNQSARNIEGVSINKSDLINVYDLVRNGNALSPRSRQKT